MIDAMLRQMLQIGRIDVDGYLSYIRSQRNFLIQTLEQFVFVHDVLLEAVSRRMLGNLLKLIFNLSATICWTRNIYFLLFRVLSAILSYT